MSALVGRDAERAAIDAAITASSDLGDVVLVTGEPGIGKSSLVDEVVERATAAGWQVRHAVADELEAGRVHALVDTLFPELVEALARGRVSSMPRSFEFAISPRLETADTVAAHVETLRRDGSVLLAVDDLQWADGESLHALSALVRRARSLGVVVVAAFRPAPMPDELAQLVDIGREVGATELVLGPLRPADVDRLAHHLLEGPIPPVLVTHLASAGGNPWLIAELVDHAHSGRLADPLAPREVGGLVPPAVHDAVRRRLRSVRDDVASLLRVAAVLGKTFTVEEVARVAAEPMGRVAIALSEGAEAGFLADDGDSMAFRHDLFRQSLEAQLPRPVARALHREAASVLHAAGASKARIAPHLVLGAAAGDNQAFDWLVDAADDAAQLAPAAAADLLAHAAQLCREDDPRYQRTERLRARLLVWGGKPPLGEQLAARLLLGEVDDAAKLELHSIRARAFFLMGRHVDAMEAIVQIEPRGGWSARDEPPLDLAETAVALLFGSDVRGAADAARRALEHEAPDPAATTLAHGVLGWVSSMTGQARDARAHGELAIESATEPAAYRYLPHLFAGIVFYAVGDVEDGRDTIRTGRSIGTRLDVGWDRAMFDWAESTMAFLSGDWSDALALGEAGEVAATESGLQIGALWYVAIGALVALRRGEREIAQSYLDRADVLVGRGGVQLGFDWWAWAHAVAAFDDGAPDRAVALLSAALRVAEQSDARSAVNFFGVDLVRSAVACGDVGAGAKAVGSLTSLASTSGLSLHAGLADHGAGLLAGDAAAVERGIAHLELANRPYERGRARADAAVLRARAGDADAAKAHARAALARFDELGATVDAARLREGLRALGVVVRGGTTATRATSGWESLTKSERAVVDLVARGLSNGEVAERLFVSRRTVESHLQHVYTKVGARSRVDLARQAADRLS